MLKQENFFCISFLKYFLYRENQLIVIGRIGKLTELFVTSENNIFDLPVDNNYILCDLEKVDYIIGFQDDEMILRNYLY